MRKTLLLEAALLLATLVGCHQSQDTAPEPVVPVQVSTARKETIRRTVAADGLLYPRDQSSIVPKISAPVGRFLVNRGDRVRAGQLLAVLENSDLKAAVADSKGQYDQAEASYRRLSAATLPEAITKAETDVNAAQQAVDAASKLLESREALYRDGALARKLVDDAQVSYAQASAQYKTAQEHLKGLQGVGKQEQTKEAAAQVESARGRYQAAQAQLSYSEIHSPISGVITDRPLYAGEMANAGSPLLTVMDVSRVVARAQVPQEQAGLLSVNDAATIAAADGSSEVAGKVTVVGPAVDPNSTTLQVWVEAANPGGRLRPGTSVRVSIVAATLKDAIVVPAEALLPSAQGADSMVVIGPDSVAHETNVKVGVQDGGKIQILSGLSPGDRVVTVGGLGLQDGTKVRITNADAQAGSAK